MHTHTHAHMHTRNSLSEGFNIINFNQQIEVSHNYLKKKAISKTFGKESSYLRGIYLEIFSI